MNDPTPAPKKALKKDDGKRPSDLGMLVLTALLIAIGIFPLFNMGADLVLHFAGEPAKTSLCSLNIRHGRYSDDEMDVDYVSADGSTHKHNESLAFLLWPRNPDDSVPCEVRYSQSWPDRYSTSWGFSRLPSRAIAFLLVDSWLLVLGVVSLCAMLRSLAHRVVGKQG